MVQGDPDVKDRLFPSSFGAATIDGKIYAMPAETVQPIVLVVGRRQLLSGLSAGFSK